MPDVQDVTVPRPAEETPVRRLPGDPGMWVFVLGDMWIFLGYFAVFMVYRHQHHHLFLTAQQHLDLVAGAVNTLVLLLSSRFVASAVQAARRRDRTGAARSFGAAALCGSAFVGIKVYEWVSLAGAGHTLASNEFFMFYFALTGVHLLHVTLGLIVLGVVLREVRLGDRGRMTVVESGAVYWHLVDLLWVLLFPLLYVMR